MKKITVKCDWCSVFFEKLAIEKYEHNFCCRAHLNSWNRERFAEYNREDNPLNTSEGQTLSTRMDKHDRLVGRGEGRAYRKYLGRHEHRQVAEAMLGRALTSDEVVHHINGDKFDNSPQNLAILSRAEHAQVHFRKQGGDAR